MPPRICARCVLSDNIPGVIIDDHGLCPLCAAEGRSAEAAPPRGPEGEARFIAKLKPRSLGSDYDCLCLYSGGKDSTFMLYVLSRRLKLRVLALTLDNWFISPQTFNNIRTTLQRLESVDHILLKPSWNLVQKSFRAGFGFEPGTPMGEKAYLVGHACLSCFGLITAHAGRLAIEKRIRNIVAGTTPGQMRQKSLRDLNARYRSATAAFRGITLPLMQALGRGDPELRSLFKVKWRELVRVPRLNLVPFYEHVRYDEREVLDTVQRELGWVRPRDTDSCSTNCQLNALGIYVHKKKYGVSPYAIPLAHDVRMGLVSRDDALAALDGELNPAIVAHVARRLGVAQTLVPELLAVEKGNEAALPPGGRTASTAPVETSNLTGSGA
jgi:tRNA(Ile)-lysidine synthase TilS/MesJ